MTQVFGILGFILSLLALFFASEVMRRASHSQSELEAALFKAMTRIQKLESNVFHVEKLAAEIRHQRKRQAETLTALAKKGEAQKTEYAEGSGERFTPSTHAAQSANRKAG
ncbi:hypothetical protein [Magnetovibrio sp.]|uniref:hypothetical protein n=1 Tax=Magnetovibrio sp. TaxID=2024836 RepID=UPI002F927E84